MKVFDAPVVPAIADIRSNIATIALAISIRRNSGVWRRSFFDAAEISGGG
jgi:hypothetical protein